MIPQWSIAADGADVTGRLADYLLALTVTDRAGMESDDVGLEIADPRAEIAIPRLGAVLSVALGYHSSGLVPMGSYAVDAVEVASPPRQLSIRGHAADLRGSIKERQTRAWEATTLGTIVSTLAQAHGLTPVTGADLVAVAVARLDQTNESDISFLTRLGQLHDAIASVKSGRLILASRAQGVAASGQGITAVTLAPADCTAWRISLSEEERYTAVEARYYDRAAAAEEWIRAGAGTSEATYRLRPTFPDRARAQAAAEAKLAALQRGEATLSLTLPGRPELAAETPLTLAGFGAELDGRWIVTTATHRLDGSGYVTTLAGEQP